MQTTSCPDERVIRAYATGSLPAQEAERFEQHYFGCDPCWSRLQRVIELRAAVSDEARSGGVARRARSGWQALAAVAAVTAAAIGLWAVLPRPGSTMRGEESKITPVVTAVEDGFEARWEEIADADVYVLAVFTDEGEQVWVRETRESSLRVQNGQLPPLDADRSLFLKLRALDELRHEVASSALVPVPAPATVP